MKKISLLLVSLMISVAGFAQVEKGSVVLSGTVGLSLQNSDPWSGDDDFNYTRLQIAPSIKYFLTDNFSVGLGIGYAMENWKEKGDSDYKETHGMFFVAPQARYYVWKNDKFGIFGDAIFGFGFGTMKWDDGDDDESDSFNAINVAFQPGVQYFFNNRFSVEVAFENFLSYRHLSGDAVGNVENSFNLDFNPFNVNLGNLSLTMNIHF